MMNAVEFFAQEANFWFCRGSSSQMKMMLHCNLLLYYKVSFETVLVHRAYQFSSSQVAAIQNWRILLLCCLFAWKGLIRHGWSQWVSQEVSAWPQGILCPTFRRKTVYFRTFRSRLGMLDATRLFSHYHAFEPTCQNSTLKQHLVFSAEFI